MQDYASFVGVILKRGLRTKNYPPAAVIFYFSGSSLKQATEAPSK